MEGIEGGGRKMLAGGQFGLAGGRGKRRVWGAKRRRTKEMAK